MSTIDNLDAHTPMMQQYLSTLINILKNKILIKKYSINIHIVYII